MLIVHDSRCANYQHPGHPERPQRVVKTVERLKSQKKLALDWAEPLPVEEAAILRAHSPEHLQRLAQPQDFDADTPSFPDILEHARRSVGGALRALKAARDGRTAFSLMRPPGHHAEREQAMGFCYLNQITIAALEAVATGCKKVAVYDFDVHHGNGTEAILADQPACAFFSIHQHPCYPGTGARDIGNAHNYPVLPSTPRQQYRETLARALKDLKNWKPDLVAVSAGFDAYARDPLSQATLELEDFHWLGQSIRRLGIPHFGILEGGYSDDLPDLILAFLKGLEGL